MTVLIGKLCYHEFFWGNFPPSFFPSFHKYLSGNLLCIGDTKIKLDIVPALKLQWRKQN